MHIVTLTPSWREHSLVFVFRDCIGLV